MKNAVDDLCNPYDFVATGIRQRLRDWRLHSYPPSNRYRGGADQSHSGTPSLIAILPQGQIGMTFRARRFSG
jgi:hypothetical protein